MTLFLFIFLYLCFLIYQLGGFNDLIERNRKIKECRRKWMNRTNKED